MPDKLQASWAARLASYASPFARVALSNVVRAYPNQPGHLLLDASGLAEPQALHPAFYGSYDWHSAVHMHWLLVILLHRYPAMPEASQIRDVLSRHFTGTNIEKEAFHFRQPHHRAFERTYGWAWLLKLHAAMTEGASACLDIARWRQALQPLADLIVRRYVEFLPLAQFPVRAGTHGNSAFGLLLLLDYARAAGRTDLAQTVGEKARAWFGQDCAYPARYEPGGDDFLSGGLLEAVLMQRILSPDAFACWWEGFCPHASVLPAWLTPVQVPDRSDPKLAHLDGLNLSRAWCWTLLRPSIPAALASAIDSAVDKHLAASLPCTTQGDYAGTHWLASFALLALLALVGEE